MEREVCDKIWQRQIHKAPAECPVKCIALLRKQLLNKAFNHATKTNQFILNNHNLMKNQWPVAFFKQLAST